MMTGHEKVCQFVYLCRLTCKTTVPNVYKQLIIKIKQLKDENNKIHKILVLWSVWQTEILVTKITTVSSPN